MHLPRRDGKVFAWDGRASWTKRCVLGFSASEMLPEHLCRDSDAA